MLRAILIDPELHSITEVEYEGVYTDIYNLIKNDGSPFDIRPLSGTDDEVVYFDDEFLLKTEVGQSMPYTFINGLPDPIGGRCLIVGTDGEGADVSSKLSICDIEANVRFANLTLEGWTAGYSKEVDHPVFGKTMQIVGPRPIFKECDVAPERDIARVKNDDKVYAAKKAAMKQLADFFEDKLKVRKSPTHEFFMNEVDKKYKDKQ